MKSQNSLHFSLVLALALLFVSCEKEEAGVSNVRLPSEQGEQYNAWMEEPLLLGSEGDCNCQYRIISFGYTGKEPGDHIEFYLTGGEPGTCELNCRYFQGVAGHCNINVSQAYDPLCDDLWATFPTPFYDFNCSPTQGSSFGVNWVLDWLSSNCIGISPTSATITFEIRCSRANPSSACREGGVYSAIKTITWPETKATVLISGQSSSQCGCRPIFVERD